MKILEGLQQGSQEWLAARERHFCASEAPIIMGCSRFVSRTEFLRRKATGDAPEVDQHTQARYDRGHEAEAKARPIIEAMIGEEFWPVVGVSDCGKYLASFDGLTMDERTGFEAKLWNADLVEQIKTKNVADEYLYQMEHQCLVGDLERVIFACSDGTEANTVWMEYRPDPERRAKLIAGWAQFEEDLKAYQHVEVLPAPAATAIMALPALAIQVVGEVKSSNLAEIQARASAQIAAINTNLQTDQDFANAEAAIKWCDKGETDLANFKALAQSQMATVDALFRAVDALAEQMRGKRLELERLVKARKDAIRAEIKVEAEQALAAHIAGLNARIGAQYMPRVPADFAGAMKNKRTITSLREAVQKCLLDAKLEANAIADRISTNMRVLEQNGEHRFLFNDAATLVQMDTTGFAAVVESRVLKHKDDQRKKEEAERERIRKEEEARAQAKAKQEAEATAEQERERIRAEERTRAEAEAKVKAEAEAKQRAAAASTPPPTPAKPTAHPVRPAPARDEIVAVIAAHYSVPKSLAEQWLDVVFA